MTDLEMTKLCAEAMDYGIVDDFADVTPPMRGVDVIPHDTSPAYAINAEPLRFAPLYDDAQAMALVKRFGLYIECETVNFTGDVPGFLWAAVTHEHEIAVEDANLNRAIVECVAKMRASDGSSTHRSAT